MKNKPLLLFAFPITSVFGLFIIGLLSVAYYYYFQQTQKILSSAKENLSSIAELKATQVEHWRTERLSDANYIYQSKEILQSCEQLIQKHTGRDANKAMQSWMLPMYKNRQYVSIGLFNLHGHELSNIPGDSAPLSETEKGAFRETAQVKKVMFADIHRNQNNKIRMGIAVPLIHSRKNDTTVIGIILLRINPETVLFPLIERWPLKSATAETFLFRTEPKSIVFLHELQQKPGSGAAFRIPLSEDDLLLRSAAQGYEGTVMGTDYRNEKVVAHIRPISNSPWYLAAKIDAQEIYAANTSTAIGLIIVVILLILLLGIGIQLLWKRQEEKRTKVLTESQIERQALIQHFEYILRYANDAIVLINSTQQIIEVNERAERMYGYDHEELLQLHISDLRSKDSLNDIDERLLMMTRPNGVVYETCHRRKDGTTFPVEISGRTITIEGKTYYQGIIRDITERIETQKAQRAREKHLSLITENFPGLVSSVDKDLRYRFASAGYEQIFGKTQHEVVGSTMREVLGAEVFSAVKAYAQQALEGQKITFINPVKIPSGEISYGMTTFTPDFDPDGNVQGIYIFALDITDRIQATETIRTNEEKYRKLIETTDTGFVIVNEHGIVLDANQKYVVMAGKTKIQDILGHSVLEWTFEPEKEINASAIKKCLNQGTIQNYEVKYIHADGTCVTVEINGTVSKSEDGIQILTLCRDVTERKKGEELLRFHEQEMRSLMNNIPEIIIRYDLHQRITFVNPGAAALLGMQNGDFAGKTLQEIGISGEIIKKFETRFQQVLEHHEMISGEDLYHSSQGLRFIEASLIPEFGSDTVLTSVLMVARDITERKRTEETLRKTEENFRRSLDESPLGIRIVTAAGDTMYVNRALLDIYGYTDLEELRNTNIMDRYTPECYKEFLIRREKRNHGEFGPSEYEISIIRKDGEIRHIQVFRKDVVWNGARQYQVIYQDITQRRKLEEPLRRMQKLEGLGTLAGGIAHDFNNILGIILGYASRVYTVKDNPEKLERTIEIITKAVDRGTTLVRQILTFARKTETEFHPINVNDIVKEIIAMIMETFPKVISYSQNLEKGIPSIYADHSQLHQALLNLCVNARDAMQKGGVLTIGTNMILGKEVQSRHTDATAEQYVCIEVGDTGEGMTSDVRGRIFEPFYSTKEKGKGTGLGLSVVFGVVQSHRGFIDVESESGKGAKFRLFLPVPKGIEQVVTEAEETIADVEGGTETVLIVEDEEALNAILQTSLTSKGYTVLTAFDGAAAVKLYEEKKEDISLVITDIGLPKMTGIDEFRRIKKINPAVRIIVATGYLDPEMRSEFLKSGVNKFLFKPYKPTDVLRSVREVLDAE